MKPTEPLIGDSDAATSSRIMEDYFSRHRHQIGQVIKCFNITPRGKAELYPIPASYQEFRELPFTTEIVLVRAPLSVYLPSEKDIAFKSSGTTGEPKLAWMPSDISTLPFSQEVRERLQNRQLVFLHSRRKDVEFFYWIHDKTHRQNFPSALFMEYNDVPTALHASLSGDVLCIYDYPSAINRFIYYLRETLVCRLCAPDQLFGKLVIIDLAGEPMDPGYLRLVKDQLTSLFGTPPVVCLSYGTTETGSIGALDGWDERNPMVYKISPNVFVEVLDEESGNPLVGRAGEIVVTPLRTRGTILIRYRTQDLGLLRFEHGQPACEVYGKKTSSGCIYVAGSQFYLPTLESAISARFEVPVQLSARVIRDNARGWEEVQIAVFCPPESNLIMKEQSVREYVTACVTKWAELSTEINTGLVHIRVHVAALSTALSPVRKAWQLRG